MSQRTYDLTSAACAGAADRCRTGLAGLVRRRPMARPSRAIDLESADDRDLVRAFVAGDPDAFEVIVRRHQRHVYRLCYRFAGNHEDAADWSQDVFVRVFKALPRFKGDAALSTWMYRVCVNACLNRVASRRAPAEPLDAAHDLAAGADSPFDQALYAERSAAVRAAVTRLPPKQRAVVVLRVYQQLSHEAIADILESSVGAVKANFFHALGRLKRELQSR
jgi:RNA polymerase sigma-70 factor (ECF subfamily)